MKTFLTKLQSSQILITVMFVFALIFVSLGLLGSGFLTKQVKADPLIFSATWDTTKTSSGSSTNTQIKLPLYNGGTYNFVVDWGDSTTNTITLWNQAEVTHTYETSGVKTINITGTITGFRFNNTGDKLKISNIHSWGPLNVGNLGQYFWGCNNLTSDAEDNLDLNGTTNLSQMFNMAFVFNGDISGWDTSNVTNMSSMFASASAFNQSLVNWETNKVTNMSNMFNSAVAFNKNVGSWDTSKVTNMANMFNGASSFNKNISTWNTGLVTSMGGMFLGAANFNQPIGNWNTGNVTDMSCMFMNAVRFNQPIGNWDTSKVTVMDYMFQGATAFNQNLGNWNTGMVEWGDNGGMYYMFEGVTLSTTNFDALLTGWASKSQQESVYIYTGNSRYSAVGLVGMEDLVNNYYWIFENDLGVQTLADAKTAAHSALTIALASYTQSNYIAGNWTTLTGYKTSGDTAIDSASSIAAVDTARATAVDGMAGVLSNAQIFLVVYVNASMTDDYGDGSTTLTAKKHINSGIPAVGSGGTINIAAGTYYEEVSVVGKTDITLNGAGEGSTIIAPYRAYTVNNYGIFVNNSHELLIQNLTIDGFANNELASGIAHFKDGVHWDSLGGNNNVITHVTVKNVDRRGISVWPETVTNNEISFCTVDNVTGVNHGGGYAHGINYNGSGKVENNTISNVTAGIMGNNNVVGGTLSIQNNVISDLTGLTSTPFDIGINIWCKQSNVIVVKNNSITANVEDNTGIYIVRGGDGSEISNNTISLTGDGGLGIETGWEGTWGFPIFNNTITMGKGGAGIVITGAGSNVDPMLIYNNVLTNVGGDDLFTNDYTGYSLREVGMLLSGHEYTSRTGDADYSFNGSVYNNTIDGFKDGLVFASQVYDAGGFKDVEIVLSEKNKIINFENAARYGYISNTSPYPFIEISISDTNYSAIDARYNWWGSYSYATIFPKISGNISFVPYYINDSMTPTAVADTEGEVTLGSDTPQVVVTDNAQSVTVTVETGTLNPIIDVGAFITDGTGTIPEITIDSPLAQVLIPTTAVTSDNSDWDGIIAAPTVTTISLEQTTAEIKTLVSAIELGYAADRLSFDDAVRILFAGQKDKRVGFIRPGEEFMEITAICANDDAESGNALAANGDCKINSGDDLVVWTKHFTTFAIYTQSIRGDININGVVNKYDFSLMMSAWGLTGTNSSDLNDDHVVDKYDFSLLMLNWSY